MTTIYKRLEAARYRLLPAKPYYRFRAWRTYVRCSYYREPEIRLLKQLVDPARTSVDVGANKGVYTYFLSRLSAHVFAYEPNPKFTPILTPVVGPKVTLFEAALSDRDGEATLTIPINRKGESNNAASLESGKFICEVKPITVAVRRLDRAGHPDVGFVKIDVEGHEEAVIRGAAGTLTDQRPTLLVEIETFHRKVDIRQTFALIGSFGYQGYMLLGGRLTSVDQFSAQEHQLGPLQGSGGQYVKNFIFLPDERAL
jgi:FkbM family methyltransferase